MVLTLVDLKDKLKPQLKDLWDVNDFEIMKASHGTNKWVVVIEYQKPKKALNGNTVFYSNEVGAIVANDSTGLIEEIV